MPIGAKLVVCRGVSSGLRGVENVFRNLVANTESLGDFHVKNNINKPVHLTSVEKSEPLWSPGMFA